MNIVETWTVEQLKNVLSQVYGLTLTKRTVHKELVSSLKAFIKDRPQQFLDVLHQYTTLFEPNEEEEFKNNLIALVNKPKSPRKKLVNDGAECKAFGFHIVKEESLKDILDHVGIPYAASKAKSNKDELCRLISQAVQDKRLYFAHYFTMQWLKKNTITGTQDIEILDLLTKIQSTLKAATPRKRSSSKVSSPKNTLSPNNLFSPNNALSPNKSTTPQQARLEHLMHSVTTDPSVQSQARQLLEEHKELEQLLSSPKSLLKNFDNYVAHHVSPTKQDKLIHIGDTIQNAVASKDSVQLNKSVALVQKSILNDLTANEQEAQELIDASGVCVELAHENSYLRALIEKLEEDLVMMSLESNQEAAAILTENVGSVRGKEATKIKHLLANNAQVVSQVEKAFDKSSNSSSSSSSKEVQKRLNVILQKQGSPKANKLKSIANDATSSTSSPIAGKVNKILNRGQHTKVERFPELAAKLENYKEEMKQVLEDHHWISAEECLKLNQTVDTLEMQVFELHEQLATKTQTIHKLEELVKEQRDVNNRWRAKAMSERNY